MSPLIDLGQQIIWGNKDWYTLVLGVAPDFVYINDWFPDRGSFFNNQDVAETARVCVLGKTVASNLFGSENSVYDAQLAPYIEIIFLISTKAMTLS